MELELAEDPSRVARPRASAQSLGPGTRRPRDAILSAPSIRLDTRLSGRGRTARDGGRGGGRGHPVVDQGHAPASRATVEGSGWSSGACSPARWTSQRLRRHPGGLRRHRGPGLGRDAAAHVPALGRAPRLQDRGDRGLRGEVAGIKSATIRSRASTPSAGCAPRPACTAWCASRRSTPATAATPRSPRCSSRPRSTTTSRSRSTRPTCAPTSTAPVRRRRPARQPTDSAVRITHMPHRHRGAVPVRPLPAQEPRRP